MIPPNFTVNDLVQEISDAEKWQHNMSTVSLWWAVFMCFVFAWRPRFFWIMLGVDLALIAVGAVRLK